MLCIAGRGNMAKQIEGVAERIIDAAKKEFLDKGYVDASLRTIAAAAKKSRSAGSCKFTKAKTEKTPRKQKRFRGVLLSIPGLIARLPICNNSRNRQERR